MFCNIYDKTIYWIFYKFLIYFFNIWLWGSNKNKEWNRNRWLKLKLIQMKSWTGKNIGSLLTSIIYYTPSLRGAGYIYKNHKHVRRCSPELFDIQHSYLQGWCLIIWSWAWAIVYNLSQNYTSYSLFQLRHLKLDIYFLLLSEYVPEQETGEEWILNGIDWSPHFINAANKGSSDNMLETFVHISS